MNCDAVHTEVVSGLTIKILPDYDGDVESPVEGSSSVIFAVYHRRYTNPAENATVMGCALADIDAAYAFENANRHKSAQWAVFPLYLYDHSGTTYRCSQGGNPFVGRLPQGHAEFDSGRVGFVALKKSDYRTVATRFAAAQSICETYTDYANGNVYGYVVEDADGNEVDSCWGFLGYEHVLGEAREVARSLSPLTTEAT